MVWDFQRNNKIFENMFTRFLTIFPSAAVNILNAFSRSCFAPWVLEQQSLYLIIETITWLTLELDFLFCLFLNLMQGVSSPTHAFKRLVLLKYSHKIYEEKNRKQNISIQVWYDEMIKYIFYLFDETRLLILFIRLNDSINLLLRGFKFTAGE